MKVLLLQLDGKIPNVALMRLGAHHKARGDQVELRSAGNAAAVQRRLFDEHDRVYGSLIFERTRPIARHLLAQRPDAILGGTGWKISSTLEDHGVTTLDQDYTLYPRWRRSVGFLQRGCRLRCPFCVVPKKEGAVRSEQTVERLWRGDPWPKELIVLDNDFFGNPRWRDRIRELRDGNFKINFHQGINARSITEETAEAVASVDYRDWKMNRRTVHTAWDNRGDERRLLRGLQLLVQAGVSPRNITVMMLIGYWPNETAQDREHRRATLRAFGAIPYPMPYRRTKELVGFQRWVLGAWDKRIPWDEWEAARYRPEQLGQEHDDRQLALIG